MLQHTDSVHLTNRKSIISNLIHVQPYIKCISHRASQGLLYQQQRFAMPFIFFLKKNLENYSWLAFYCSVNSKRSCFLWRLRAVTYHCRWELFSLSCLLVMIYNTPFYLNPGVAGTFCVATTKNRMSVIYNHISESLDHSHSLQYHFSVINRFRLTGLIARFSIISYKICRLLQKLLHVETSQMFVHYRKCEENLLQDIYFISAF